jgi:hypothetical protein
MIMPAGASPGAEGNGTGSAPQVGLAREEARS